MTTDFSNAPFISLIRALLKPHMGKPFVQMCITEKGKTQHAPEVEQIPANALESAD